jgi:FKBP-type peptidyl-prolyl cis-trans isomerase FkpA
MSVTAVPIRPIKKGSLVKLWVGLGALCLIAAGIAWAGTRDQVSNDPASYLASNAKSPGVATTASGLQIRMLSPGRGPQIGPNDGVIINYEGRLLDGTVFGTTKGRQPAPMLVSQVVPGFAEALQLMQPGGSYRIWLPPELAYGSDVPPGGPIPPNAVLEFDVSVLQVVPNAALQVGPGAVPPPAASQP